ncbi:MAG: 50S ribosomal protein L13 [Candidatus Omnitrophica bacterium]|nr:50S ribosomal protein L13 [Candidatus Omnitrophota bacterium]
MKKTKFFNPKERRWVVIDAKDKVLGRLATRIAIVLQGKNKATYTPNSICGDRVVVINARHARLTANKAETKSYDRYSGYPSGRKDLTLKELMKKNPTRVMYLAVKGMVPKNNRGREMMKSLKIYAEAEHNQQAQKPESINI